MHDRDTKFMASFDDVLKSADLEVKETTHLSPNTLAYFERFIQTLRKDSRKATKPPPDAVPVSRIECREQRGGLLKHYYRRTA